MINQLKAALALFLLPVFALAQHPMEKTVVDHYASLPKMKTPSGMDWQSPPIVEKNGSYFVSYENADDPERLEDAEVSTRDGYMKFTYDETGGGGITQTVALYVGSKRRISLAVNLEEFDGVYAVSRLYFFKLEDTTFVDDTENAMPDSIFYKMSEGAITEEMLKGKTPMNLYNVELPKKGMTAVVRPNQSFLKYKCKQKEDNYCDIQKAIKYDEMRMHFDRRKVGYKVPRVRGEGGDRDDRREEDGKSREQR